MKTPTTLKSAIKAGYVIKKIDYANSKKCRVDLEPRFYDQTMKPGLSFWMSSTYIKREYNSEFQTYGILR